LQRTARNDTLELFHFPMQRRRVMREKYYKPAEARDFVTAAELVACKYCRVRIAEPECANIPEGEWYCPNPECVVRECTIRCKLYGEQLPQWPVRVRLGAEIPELDRLRDA